MKKVNAIVLHEHGKPSDVVKVETREVPEPGRGEALVEMLAAPINPADLNVLEGTYPIRPELPGVPGGEGLGEVTALGPGTDGPPLGTRVIVPHKVGSWCEACIAPADRLVEVPRELDVEQAAMMGVNPPTAWRMLHDFASLSAGDWVVQNAANSGVGRAVIAICRSRGIRSLNLVRREELIAELEDAGADAVLVDGENVVDEIKARTKGGAVKLGLNAVGGESALHVANALSRGGVHVTYGAMGRKPLRIPNGLLIFKEIAFRGFWISKWMTESAREQREEMFAPLFEMACRGELKVKVAATYPLTEARKAVEHAMREARGGKVLFRMRTGD